MSAGLRKLALTAHVTSSVGWLGAVAGFFALAVAGLTSRNLQTVRAAYVAMEMTGWYVIVPLCFASILTGILQSLGTTWGLFRHYWVVAKLLISILATVVLLVHMQPIGDIARVAAEETLAAGDLHGMRIQLVADAGAALLVLLVATTLSVYKPRGLTRYGWRRQREDTATADSMRPGPECRCRRHSARCCPRGDRGRPRMSICASASGKCDQIIGVARRPLGIGHDEADARVQAGRVRQRLGTGDRLAIAIVAHHLRGRVRLGERQAAKPPRS